jgi:hypothetical protein
MAVMAFILTKRGRGVFYYSSLKIFKKNLLLSQAYKLALTYLLLHRNI